MSGPTTSPSATLLRAFPREVRDVARQVIADLPEAPVAPVGDIADSNHRPWPALRVRGEAIAIPHRIYNPVAERIADNADGNDAAVAACLYSRHHDGHVRQAVQPALLASRAWWAVPFVVQLLGEYVIEIGKDVAVYVVDELPKHPGFQAEFYGFRDANRPFIDLTTARAVSYWAEHHRHEYHQPEAYPALVALARLTARAAR